MGIDALLWARKSNTYYDLDRERNFTSGLWVESDPLREEESELLKRVMDKLGSRQLLTCKDVCIAAKLNIRAHSYELDSKDPHQRMSAVRAILHNVRIHEMANNIS